jgi:hypothetical protein
MSRKLSDVFTATAITLVTSGMRTSSVLRSIIAVE